MNCGITTEANISFQIFYHLLPLYLMVHVLENTKQYPTILVFIIIFLFHVSYDFMLYRYNVFDVYECRESSTVALISLIGIDVLTITLSFIFVKIRKYNIKKQKIYC